MKNKKFIYIGVLVLCLVFVAVFIDKRTKEDDVFNDVSYNTEANTNDTENNKEEKKELTFELSDGLVITKVGSYSGKFVEDGSDEEVKDVLGIVVKNTSGTALQYCEIAISGNNGVANFKLSTLMPNESMIVLESSRQKFIDEDNTYLNATAKNVAFFLEEPKLHGDKFSVQALDGALNVTNKSDESIVGPVYIYYKNKLNDLYLGGITYRCKVEYMHPGDLKQVMTNHFDSENSEIMFITVGQ